MFLYTFSNKLAVLIYEDITVARYLKIFAPLATFIYLDTVIEFRGTEEEIVKFESTLKFPLPQEYREFLKFSNGARIMGEEIYGLDSIGSSDVYVPDGYLAISSTEMTSERMAISEEDGQVYLFWDLKGNPWNIEDYFYDQLEECKKIIDAHDREVEQQKRRENS